MIPDICRCFNVVEEEQLESVEQGLGQKILLNKNKFAVNQRPAENDK